LIYLAGGLGIIGAGFGLIAWLAAAIWHLYALRWELKTSNHIAGKKQQERN
jgi:hypothetical protein